MGRYYWNKKNTVEDCRSVSIAFLKKHGYFCGYKLGWINWTNNLGEKTASIGISVSLLDGDNYVRFEYTSTDRHTGEKTDYDYEVKLTTTPCNYGGVRYWFICPMSRNGVACGRRVSKLYLAPGSNYFGCRHCFNLSYESRNESRLGRIGQMGYILKVERQYEELYKKTQRRTWKGRPTRKARRLHILEQKLDQGDFAT